MKSIAYGVYRDNFRLSIAPDKPSKNLDVHQKASVSITQSKTISIATLFPQPLLDLLAPARANLWEVKKILCFSLKVRLGIATSTSELCCERRVGTYPYQYHLPYLYVYVDEMNDYKIGDFARTWTAVDRPAGGAKVTCQFNATRREIFKQRRQTVQWSSQIIFL